MKTRRVLLVCVATALLLGSANPAVGQQVRIEKLERRVMELERLMVLLAKRIVQLEAAAGHHPVVKQPTASTGWKNRDVWRKLQRGMRKEQVTALLGEPERIRTLSTLDFWYYPKGSVAFHAETHTIHSWDEPDFR